MTFLGILLTSALVIGLLFLYFIYITTPKKRGGQKSGERIDLSIIPSKWNEVEAMVRQGGPANFKQSIMDGDKLVDTVLRTKVSGNTMAERLKNARHLFSKDTYDTLWTAHKIRNKIAHEADFEGLSSDSQLAMRYFKKALQELRVI
jgi:hypothetical protein